MRKFLDTFIMIITCFLLQTTLFRYIAFGGVVPNLLMILTASTGIMRGEKEGLVTGFICGLLIDIFFGSFLGFYALIYMYIGFIDGVFNKIFFPENIILPLGIILSSDFLYGFTCSVLLFLMRAKFDIGYYMMHVIIPEIVYTAVVSLILYPLILKINTRLDEIIQRSAKKFV